MLIHKLDDDTDSSNETDYDNLCHICYENIDENQDTAILTCGHKFHYKCILLVFKSALQKSIVSSKQCPYCRNNTGYLPLIPGIQPIKFIHEEYNPNGDMPILYIPGKCKYILKRGPNSGHQCSSSIKTPDGYCKKHQKLLDAKKKKTESESENNNENQNIVLPEYTKNKLATESINYINELYDSILGESN